MRYEGPQLFIADPIHENWYYPEANCLQEINVNSTAREMLKRSKELFHQAEKPGETEDTEVVLRKKTTLKSFLYL